MHSVAPFMKKNTKSLWDKHFGFHELQLILFLGFLPAMLVSWWLEEGMCAKNLLSFGKNEDILWSLSICVFSEQMEIQVTLTL